MKKFLWLAILLPLGSYLPFLGLGNQTRELNIIVYPLFLLAGMAMGVAFLVTIRLKRKVKTLFSVLVGLFYAVIVMGLTDCILLFTDNRPFFIQSSGEGFADLGVFVAWVILLIPLSYVLTTILHVVAYFIQRRNNRKTVA